MFKRSNLVAILLLAVSASSHAVMDVCSGSLASIEADKDHDGILFVDQPGKKGTAWCNYSDDGVLDKPIIVAEGFDFMATALGDAAQNTTGLEIWTLLNAHDDAEALRAKGYDFIVLDYHEPLAAIQANALVYSKLVQVVNEEKVGIFKNISMGLSMGGLVAKSGLAFMEYDGIDHDTSLYVSLDSPHGCAQVNTDLQMLMQFAAGQDMPEAKRMWEDVLRSDAAFQMLCYAAYDYNDDVLMDIYSFDRKTKVRKAYETYRLKYSISGDGFPSLTQNVAFANGSGDRQTAAPGDLLVSFDVGTDLLDINATDQTVPYDTMPGSSMPWFGLFDQFIDPADVNMTVVPGLEDITFISTISAIGLGPIGHKVKTYGSEVRSDDYWQRYQSALLATESPSAEEKAAATEGLSEDEYWDYLSSLNLYNFHMIDTIRGTTPRDYLEDGMVSGIIPTFESCYDYEREIEGSEETETVTNCNDMPITDIDLTLVDNLASHTPFDFVYLNNVNGQHADVPAEHSENLVKEVLKNTHIKIELILPALMLLI